MKKAIFITTFALYFICSATLFGQNENQEIKLKREIDSMHKVEQENNKKEKAMKKELHMLKSKDVSDFTKKQFEEDFSSIDDVRWERLDSYDEATFLNNGVLTKAYYNSTSELMGTIVNKTFLDLPKKAQTMINKKYNDYEKVLVIFYDDSDFNEAHLLLYNEEINGPDTYFIELRKEGHTTVLGFDAQGDLIFDKKLH